MACLCVATDEGQCHITAVPRTRCAIAERAHCCAFAPNLANSVSHGGSHQALLQMVVTRSTARSLRSEHKYIFQSRSLRQKAAHITSHSLSRRWLRTCSDLDDLMGTTGDASEESDDMSARHLDLTGEFPSYLRATLVGIDVQCAQSWWPGVISTTRSSM